MHYITVLHCLYKNGNHGKVDDMSEKNAMVSLLKKQEMNDLQQALKNQHSNIDQLWANQQVMESLS